MQTVETETTSSRVRLAFAMKAPGNLIRGRIWRFSSSGSRELNSFPIVTRLFAMMSKAATGVPAICGQAQRPSRGIDTGNETGDLYQL